MCESVGGIFPCNRVFDTFNILSINKKKTIYTAILPHTKNHINARSCDLIVNTNKTIFHSCLFFSVLHEWVNENVG